MLKVTPVTFLQSSRAVLSIRRLSYKGKHISFNASIEYGLQDSMNTRTAEQEDQLKDEESKYMSFRDLGVTPRLCNLLTSSGITEPNAIQKSALPITSKRGKAGSCVIQSETGSGKTFTYLLPALQENLPGLTSLIITPTRELAVQVCHWAQKFAGNSKNSRRIGLLVSGRTEEKLLEMFCNKKPHILIGTPKAIKRVVDESDEIGLSLQRIILDEADILLEPLHPKAPWRVKRNREIHPKPTELIMKTLGDKIKRRNVQLICTSATIPKSLKEELLNLGWENPLQTITTTESAKQVPSSISHGHILCNESEEKGVELVRHFKEGGYTSALVFIHRDASIMKFTEELRDLGVVAVPLYSSLDNPNKLSNFLSKFETGKVQLIVGNEETVRGLDFPFLGVVYLTEVPRNATEYLHSSGRVGRCGKRGEVVVLLETSQEATRMKRIYQQLKINYHQQQEEESSDIFSSTETQQ